MVFELIINPNVADLLQGFEVENCIKLNSFEDGSIDHDSAIYKRFDCKTRKEAIKLAKKLLPCDKFGCVSIVEFIRESFERKYPNVFHKVYVGNAFYVD